MIANWKKLVPWVAGGLALLGAATMLIPRSSVRGFPARGTRRRAPDGSRHGSLEPSDPTARPA